MASNPATSCSGSFSIDRGDSRNHLYITKPTNVMTYKKKLQELHKDIIEYRKKFDELYEHAWKFDRTDQGITKLKGIKKSSDERYISIETRIDYLENFKWEK